MPCWDVYKVKENISQLRMSLTRKNKAEMSKPKHSRKGAEKAKEMLKRAILSGDIDIMLWGRSVREERRNRDAEKRAKAEKHFEEVKAELRHWNESAGDTSAWNQLLLPHRSELPSRDTWDTYEGNNADADASYFLPEQEKGVEEIPAEAAPADSTKSDVDEAARKKRKALKKAASKRNARKNLAKAKAAALMVEISKAKAEESKSAKLMEQESDPASTNSIAEAAAAAAAAFAGSNTGIVKGTVAGNEQEGGLERGGGKLRPQRRTSRYADIMRNLKMAAFEAAMRLKQPEAAEGSTAAGNQLSQPRPQSKEGTAIEPRKDEKTSDDSEDNSVRNDGSDGEGEEEEEEEEDLGADGKEKGRKSRRKVASREKRKSSTIRDSKIENAIDEDEEEEEEEGSFGGGTDDEEDEVYWTNGGEGEEEEEDGDDDDDDEVVDRPMRKVSFAAKIKTAPISSSSSTTVAAAAGRGTKPRRRRSSMSVDVVADLFKMSNELRQERESIMLRNVSVDMTGHKNNMSAFLNRDATLKYNEELEDVAQKKQEAKLAARRAAILRLKRDAVKFQVHSQEHTQDFAMFWSKLIEENEKFNEASVYDKFFAPVVIPGELEDEAAEGYGDEGDDVGGSANDEDAKLSEDPFAAPDLEKAFSLDLSLFYQTKAKASEWIRQNSPRSSMSIQELEKSKSREQDAVHDNVLDATAVLDRMKDMGILSEDAFEHTYGIEPTLPPGFKDSIDLDDDDGNNNKRKNGGSSNSSSSSGSSSDTSSGSVKGRMGQQYVSSSSSSEDESRRRSGVVRKGDKAGYIYINDQWIPVEYAPNTPPPPEYVRLHQQQQQQHSHIQGDSPRSPSRERKKRRRDRKKKRRENEKRRRSSDDAESDSENSSQDEYDSDDDHQYSEKDMKHHNIVAFLGNEYVSLDYRSLKQHVKDKLRQEERAKKRRKHCNIEFIDGEFYAVEVLDEEEGGGGRGDEEQKEDQLGNQDIGGAERSKQAKQLRIPRRFRIRCGSAQEDEVDDDLPVHVLKEGKVDDENDNWQQQSEEDAKHVLKLLQMDYEKQLKRVHRRSLRTAGEHTGGKDASDDDDDEASEEDSDSSCESLDSTVERFETINYRQYLKYYAPKEANAEANNNNNADDGSGGTRERVKQQYHTRLMKARDAGGIGITQEDADAAVSVERASEALNMHVEDLNVEWVHMGNFTTPASVRQHFEKFHLPHLLRDSQPEVGLPVPALTTVAPQSDVKEIDAERVDISRSLAGIWPYDPSLGAFNALLQLARAKRRERRRYKKQLSRVKKLKQQEDARRVRRQQLFDAMYALLDGADDGSNNDDADVSGTDTGITAGASGGGVGGSLDQSNCRQPYPIKYPQHKLVKGRTIVVRGGGGGGGGDGSGDFVGFDDYNNNNNNSVTAVVAAPTGSDHREIGYDPSTLQLTLSTYVNDLEVGQVKVDINSVFLTQSAAGRSGNMLTLRTKQPRQMIATSGIASVPLGGYLGTVSISQWNAIEQEISNSMIQFSNSLVRSNKLKCGSTIRSNKPRHLQARVGNVLRQQHSGAVAGANSALVLSLDQAAASPDPPVRGTALDAAYTHDGNERGDSSVVLQHSSVMTFDDEIEFDSVTGMEIPRQPGIMHPFQLPAAHYLHALSQQQQQQLQLQQQQDVHGSEQGSVAPMDTPPTTTAAVAKQTRPQQQQQRSEEKHHVFITQGRKGGLLGDDDDDDAGNGLRLWQSNNDSDEDECGFEDKEMERLKKFADMGYATYRQFVAEKEHEDANKEKKKMAMKNKNKKLLVEHQPVALPTAGHADTAVTATTIVRPNVIFEVEPPPLLRHIPGVIAAAGATPHSTATAGAAAGASRGRGGGGGGGGIRPLSVDASMMMALSAAMTGDRVHVPPFSAPASAPANAKVGTAGSAASGSRSGGRRMQAGTTTTTTTTTTNSTHAPPRSSSSSQAAEGGGGRFGSLIHGALSSLRQEQEDARQATAMAAKLLLLNTASTAASTAASAAASAAAIGGGGGGGGLMSMTVATPPPQQPQQQQYMRHKYSSMPSSAPGELGAAIAAQAAAKAFASSGATRVSPRIAVAQLQPPSSSLISSTDIQAAAAAAAAAAVMDASSQGRDGSTAPETDPSSTQVLPALAPRATNTSASATTSAAASAIRATSAAAMGVTDNSGVVSATSATVLPLVRATTSLDEQSKTSLPVVKEGPLVSATIPSPRPADSTHAPAVNPSSPPHQQQHQAATPTASVGTHHTPRSSHVPVPVPVPPALRAPTIPRTPRPRHYQTGGRSLATFRASDAGKFARPAEMEEEYAAAAAAAAAAAVATETTATAAAAEQKALEVQEKSAVEGEEKEEGEGEGVADSQEVGGKEVEDEEEEEGGGETGTVEEGAEAVATADFQIVMLMESRRLMQLYFTKKFLQLDLAVTVHLTPYDVMECLKETPHMRGLILVNFEDLLPIGVERALGMLVPEDTDTKSRHSVVVYNAGECDDKTMEQQEAFGILDTMEEPYSLSTLRAMLRTHRQKQQCRKKFQDDF